MNEKDIFTDLPAQSIILTPNRRLTVALAQRYHQYQLSLNLSAWPTLTILPYHSWLEKLWREFTLHKLVASPYLLSQQEELVIWEELIITTPETAHLMQISETAELAKKAWDTLKQYDIALSHPELQINENCQIFLNWAKQFSAWCKKNNSFDQASLAHQLLMLFENETLPTPSKIILYGFTEFAPIQKKLLACCEKKGAEIVYQHQYKAHKAYQLAISDSETEILTMARFAKWTYDKNPSAQIACIVPNLEDHRDKVQRIFTSIFTDEGQYATASLHLPFNISAGKSLLNYPIIQAALNLLSLLKNNEIPPPQLDLLLHSPFIDSAETEFYARAELHDVLTKQNKISISFEDLIKQKNCPALANVLKITLASFKQFKQKQLFSEWCEVFVTLLKTLGWPGERSINSEEYQVVQRWLDLLTEYKKLTILFDPKTYSEALYYLRRLTQKIVFQAESPSTPIQILGLLEAAELNFDAMWVMGMDDTSWPPAPKPNPFISPLLQKKLNMPHASAERELVFCQTLLDQLKNSANEIIFSYPLQNEAGELRSSALIETLPNYPHIIAAKSAAATLIYQHKTLETFQDNQGPPIEAPEIRGGAKLFELQAACPFRAFAELRLQAKPQDSLSLGFRPLDRGIIVHKILELLWREIKTQESLLALSFNELADLILQTITLSLKPYQNQYKQKYLYLEKTRLQKIIHEWLALEKQRPPFKIVSQEKEYQVTVGNLSLNLRIDRIDEVAGMGNLVIDYKTGKNFDIKNCFGERPEALQLPLYCFVDPQKIIGIAFAKLHAEKIALEGVSHCDLALSGIKFFADIKYSDKAIWSEQITHWQQTLTQLSHDFAAGNAAVDPKHSVLTCQYCQLKPFCRIDDTSTAHG